MALFQGNQEAQANAQGQAHHKANEKFAETPTDSFLFRFRSIPKAKLDELPPEAQAQFVEVGDDRYQRKEFTARLVVPDFYPRLDDFCKTSILVAIAEYCKKRWVDLFAPIPSLSYEELLADMAKHAASSATGSSKASKEDIAAFASLVMDYIQTFSTKDIAVRVSEIVTKKATQTAISRLAGSYNEETLGKLQARFGLALEWLSEQASLPQELAKVYEANGYGDVDALGDALMRCHAMLTKVIDDQILALTQPSEDDLAAAL
jgi:hypothetical protein